VHSCPEAESRKSPRERERKIQVQQKKREGQRNLKMTEARD
jgi:hypothetical protein